MNPIGERLFRLVQAYSDIGGHRTGTPGDQRTIDWFSNELIVRGAQVESVPYRFTRYAADCRLTANDIPVDALPLYYEAIGEVNSSHIHIAELAIDSISHASQLDEVLGNVRSSGVDAAVLATTGVEGRLFALNRAPELRNRLPAVLAPGSALRLLVESSVHLELNASLIEADSATVIGHLGRTDVSGSVVVTTSLSGWFSCAGERGTGIAIALHLADKLAEHWPVTVVGTTGHELHHLGLRHCLAHHRFRPLAVVHLGASVAAATAGHDGGLALAPDRWAQITVERGLARHIETILASASLTVKSDVRRIGGEAKDWLPFGKPIFSVVGGFPLFHTPDDLPERATSPTLLDITYNAVSQAVQLFLNESF
jgi:hypothetical protein